MVCGSPIRSAGLISALLLAGPIVHADELKLIAAVPMTGVVKELGSQFERGSKHSLAMTFVSGPTVKQEFDAGRTYDLAISITPVINSLIKDGKLLASTRSDIAYAVVGVGVRAGAPKPDITTVNSFRQALLNAKTVAHSATGASGDHFKTMLQKLGIADQMQAKLRPMPADTIAQAVPSGQAEMIVVTASVILVPGAELVGPVPTELQFYNTFAAAVASQSNRQEAGREFITLLRGSGVVSAFRKYGMEPGIPK